MFSAQLKHSDNRSTDWPADLSVNIAINMRWCFRLTDFRVTLYLLLSTAYRIASKLVYMGR
jgi:hypothetical protein